jgi:LPXTG-site transpeptidase (sortase) family protein
MLARPLLPSTTSRGTTVATPWTLQIPSIGVTRQIYIGGQSAIDSGYATLYDGWGPTIPPGEAGTFWVTGHRTTHGKVFRNLPSLKVGAAVYVWAPGVVYTYRITTRTIVNPTPSLATVYGTDPAAARILLQCSWTRGRAIMYAGVLETVTFAR